jgi:hypothetical protein
MEFARDVRQVGTTLARLGQRALLVDLTSLTLASIGAAVFRRDQ